MPEPLRFPKKCASFGTSNGSSIASSGHKRSDGSNGSPNFATSGGRSSRWWVPRALCGGSGMLFPRNRGPWLRAAGIVVAGALALWTTHKLQPPAVPVAIDNASAELDAAGLWTVTADLTIREACRTLLLKSSFSDQAADQEVLITPTHVPWDTGPGAISQTRLAVGTYTGVKWSFRPQAGRRGLFQIWGGAGGCASGWSKVVPLVTLPYDWSRLPPSVAPIAPEVPAVVKTP